MRAVILAGGLGTRLRPYTTIIPKPLVPIGDRPVLEHIVRSLADHGVDRIDVCLGHLGHLIRMYLSQIDLPEALRLRFHWEDEPLGTAGALQLIPDLDDTTIVMNGDVLTNLDYRALVEFHHDHDAALTIAMRAERVTIELGVIESEDGVVRDYIEKPTFDYDVSMGIYVYAARALQHVPLGPLSFPDLVLRLLDRGERVVSYRTDAKWHDIGTMAQYERAAAEVERSPEDYHLGPARGSLNGSRPAARIAAGG